MNIDLFLKSLSDWIKNKEQIENVCFIVKDSSGNYKRYSEIDSVFIDNESTDKTLLIQLKK